MIEDILKGVLGGRSEAWVELLTRRFEFSLEQAQTFVAVAIERLAGLVGTGGVDLSRGIDPIAILAKLDVAGLAAQAGVEADMARSGVEAMLADAESSFGEQMAGMTELLSQLEGDGADGLGKLGDLFGK